MQNSGVGREVLLDMDDNNRTSVDSTTSYFSADEDHELKHRIFNPESWMGDMKSVRERRQKFLSTMGFEVAISSQSEKPSGVNLPPAQTDVNVAALDDKRQEDCIRNLDNGKVFVVHEHGDDGLPIMLKELGSNKLLTYQEFENLLGLPCYVHKLMGREVSNSREKQCEGFVAGRKHWSWWRRIINKRHIVQMCKLDVSVKNCRPPRTMRTNVLRHRKRCGELTGLFVEQDIRAHKGSIRTMKFSPSGWYLASGGEDCIVRIWQIKEAETSYKCVVENVSANIVGKGRKSSLFGMKGGNGGASIVFPKKTFNILERPRHEFSGHTCEILDLSWSSSNLLLTSSMDKTVRLWKVGCDGCLQIFLHNDYVTCIQFNPVNERYFISGSIDGKVRIWGLSENHVVDWVDIRDIVTAVCYRTDGKGIVVGSINGNCRFYDHLRGNSMHLCMQVSIEGKQKPAGKRITGLQISPDDPQQIMITSADSRVRIFDGFGVVHKFRGLRKTKSHTSASFTSNGRHIVSVGEDSNVYIWNCDLSNNPTTRRPKSKRSFQALVSEGTSVAVPWPNMDQESTDTITNNLHLPSPIKIFAPWFSNSERIFLGCWMFADGVSRVGPAEKLPLSAENLSQVENGEFGSYKRGLNHHYQQLISRAAMWSMGIVTASSDGFIRSFHIYGMPVWS